MLNCGLSARKQLRTELSIAWRLKEGLWMQQHGLCALPKHALKYLTFLNAAAMRLESIADFSLFVVCFCSSAELTLVQFTMLCKSLGPPFNSLYFAKKL